VIVLLGAEVETCLVAGGLSPPLRKFAPAVSAGDGNLTGLVNAALTQLGLAAQMFLRLVALSFTVTAAAAVCSAQRPAASGQQYLLYLSDRLFQEASNGFTYSRKGPVARLIDQGE
jgi:hypothetical protein